MDNQDEKTMLLLGIFVSGLVLANILGTKITSLFGISVSVAIFAYPLTFLCTDIVEEVRGKAVTMRFVKAGIIALVLTFLLVWVSISLSPHPRFENNDSYVTVFSSSLRMILASLIGFALSQTHDVWAFAFLKKKTKGRFLWLRNTLSTSVSQLIDTTVFMFIAFYQVSPKFTAPFIISLIVPYWLFKVLFAALDTPLVYLGVKWFKGKG